MARRAAVWRPRRYRHPFERSASSTPVFMVCLDPLMNQQHLRRAEDRRPEQLLWRAEEVIEPRV